MGPPVPVTALTARVHTPQKRACEFLTVVTCFTGAKRLNGRSRAQRKQHPPVVACQELEDHQHPAAEGVELAPRDDVRPDLLDENLLGDVVRRPHVAEEHHTQHHAQ
eukprot:4575220-Pyramimonas_sp.AAC.2